MFTTEQLIFSHLTYLARCNINTVTDVAAISYLAKNLLASVVIWWKKKAIKITTSFTITLTNRKHRPTRKKRRAQHV
jgi:hypothetical protein